MTAEPFLAPRAVGRHWPSLLASALLRRAAHRDCLPRIRPPSNRILSPGVFVPLQLANSLACFLPLKPAKYLSLFG